MKKKRAWIGVIVSSVLAVTIAEAVYFGCSSIMGNLGAVCLASVVGLIAGLALGWISAATFGNVFRF